MTTKANRWWYSIAYYSSVAEEYYKRQYFETIGIINGSLREGQGVSFVRQIEKLLLDSSNANSASLPTYLKCLLKVSHFDTSKDIWVIILLEWIHNCTRSWKGGSSVTKMMYNWWQQAIIGYLYKTLFEALQEPLHQQQWWQITKLVYYDIQLDMSADICARRLNMETISVKKNLYFVWWPLWEVRTMKSVTNMKNGWG